MVYLKDVKDASGVMVELRNKLEKRGFDLMDHQPDPFWMKFEVVAGEDWVGQKYDLTTWEDEVSYMNWTVTALDAITFFLVSVLLLLIVVGIMNAMWIAVRERTQEIGTLRAIGMGRWEVLLLFLVEALLLALFATGSGALLGGGIAWVADAAQIAIPSEGVQAILASDTLNLSVRPGQILGAIFSLSLVTMGASFWPALKAARMRPVSAIHFAG